VFSGEAGLKRLGWDENVFERGARVAEGDQSHPLRVFTSLFL